MGVRRWVAWKLVQVAAKIYDTETHERITVWDSLGGLIGTWTVTGDAYGCGITSGPTRLAMGFTATLDFDDARRFGREAV